MIIRNIILSDYEKYKTLINSTISFDYFTNFINNILNNNHIILVIEDNNNLIGTGTLLIEEKMTYGGCKMGHIENILIEENSRGKNYGYLLINNMISISKTKGCYRIELNCDDNLIKFYEKNNLYKYQNSMSLLIKENFN